MLNRQILFLTFVLLPTFAIADEITSVTVRGKGFDMIKEIRDHKGLSEFRDHWKKKEQITSDTRIHPIYKIDIEPGDRWLYDPSGYVSVLSKAKGPIFKINKPEEFNGLLGIPAR